MTALAQSASANVIVGPLLNASGSVMTGLTIANDAILLIKYNSASTARSATTSAVSVGPAQYRIVLNATDTDTLGELAVQVSGSGALLFTKYVDIWQAPTHALFFGSADEFATSADIAGLSATVANVSTAVANVSAAISGHAAQALQDHDAVTSAAVSAIVSAVVSGVLNSYNVASAGALLTSAGVSAQVNTVLTNYDVPTSADVSAIGSVVAAQALVDRRLHVFIAASATADAAHNNSLLGRILTSASSDQFDRATDSLAAIADRTGGLSATVANVSGAVAGVSAALSGHVAQALQDISLHVLVAGSAASPHNNSLIGQIMTSASADQFDRTSDSLAAIADGAGAVPLTSAETSAIVAQGLSDYAPSTLTTADASVVVDTALDNYGVASAGDVPSAQASWNISCTEPVSAPVWASVNRGQGLDWIMARATNRHSQTETEVQIYTSGGAAIASASISNNSVSATRDQFRG